MLRLLLPSYGDLPRPVAPSSTVATTMVTSSHLVSPPQPDMDVRTLLAKRAQLDHALAIHVSVLFIYLFDIT